MANRLALAPLTNCQSHDDGTLSRTEHDWLVMRAAGGFGLTMTAAAYVQPEGKGFPGQIGLSDDRQIPALSALADAIRAEGSLAVAQLYHAGQRTTRALTGCEVLAPSDDSTTGARAMTEAEVEAMIEAFVSAAVRARAAGFDGVELHGAHTYLLCAFLSPHFNRRQDRYGGSAENRARPIREIIRGIRDRCGPGFNLGLRLSPERMGVTVAEMRSLAGELMLEGRLDYLDLSLWDSFKLPEEEAHRDRPLIAWFADLERGGTRLGVAGQIRSASAVRAALAAGADFVLVGRAAIPHHDFARHACAADAFEWMGTPVPRNHLAAQGVSPVFSAYLAKGFPGFVEP